MSPHLYFGIKYHPDQRNRTTIEAICARFVATGCTTTCVVRDIERWGEVHLAPPELMTRTFAEIDRADYVVLEMAEKGVGLGIEAGYAHAQGLPIIVLVPAGTPVSETLAGIAHTIFSYATYDDIADLARVLCRENAGRASAARPASS